MTDSDPAWPLLQLALCGQEHPDPQVREVSTTLMEWCQAGAPERLERAIGIIPAPGQRSAQTQAQIAQRDDLVREMAADHYPNLRSHPAACEMHKRWGRYASSSWPRERMQDDVPPHRIGKPEGKLWRIMKLEDRVLSESSIRKILAAS